MESVYTEIAENTKLARESALFGKYDASQVYYQGVLQQTQKLLITIRDADRKSKWEQVDLFLTLYYTKPTFNDPERDWLLETLWEKDKVLVTSIFSFSHNVFKLHVCQTVRLLAISSG